MQLSKLTWYGSSGSHEVAGGWPASRTWEAQEGAVDALIGWQGSLGEQYEPILKRIATVLLDEEEIAPGWLPASVDDPLLIELFRRYWDEPR